MLRLATQVQKTLSGMLHRYAVLCSGVVLCSNVMLCSAQVSRYVLVLSVMLCTVFHFGKTHVMLCSGVVLGHAPAIKHATSCYTKVPHATLYHDHVHNTSMLRLSVALWCCVML
jgi:hypothetical protein